MLVPDVNLLLYATIDAFERHGAARAWWEGLLSGRESVGLPLVSCLGFVRIATNRRVFTDPMAVSDASETVRSWVARPNVSILQPGPDHLERVLDLLLAAGTAGNLTTDARIAALALEHRGVVATQDGDFSRFPDVRVVNPLH